MNVDAEVAVLEKQRKTLTQWGAWGTALYLGGIFSYSILGWAEFTKLVPNTVGDFFAGVFAPLAFLWLVIGYRMQALELEQNSKALQAQVLEMKNSVGASKQNVLNQAIDVYRYELSRICYDINLHLCNSNCAVKNNKIWEEYSHGNVNIVVIDLINNKQILLLGVPLPLIVHDEYNINRNMPNYADAYVSLFDKFMVELSSLDESGVFVKVFNVSPFKEVRDILDSTVAKPCEGQS